MNLMKNLQYNSQYSQCRETERIVSSFNLPLPEITALENSLGTRQLPRLLPKEICIFFNVRRQIIAEAKFS